MRDSESDIQDSEFDSEDVARELDIELRKLHKRVSDIVAQTPIDIASLIAFRRVFDRRIGQLTEYEWRLLRYALDQAITVLNSPTDSRPC